LGDTRKYLALAEELVGELADLPFEVLNLRRFSIRLSLGIAHHGVK
jgi:hypothetical protein